jgi:hypothetical protein
LCMLMARVITCTQFKRDYVDAIDMWDAARAGRVDLVGRSLSEKSLGVGGAPENQFALRNDDQINLPPLGSPL